MRSRIVFERERKHRREYDESLLNELHKVVAKLQDEGYPDQQVTFGYIASIIGSTRDKLRCSGNLQIRTLLESIIESKEAWLCRRIILAYQRRPVSDKPFTIADIKRDLAIHSKAYSKYQKLIELLIEELNKNGKMV